MVQKKIRIKLNRFLYHIAASFMKERFPGGGAAAFGNENTIREKDGK